MTNGFNLLISMLVRILKTIFQKYKNLITKGQRLQSDVGNCVRM